jgi:hypothetical protein
MGSEGDEEVPVFKKMDGSEDNGEDEEALGGGGGMDESAPAEDLFSEIHLGQLKRLEKQLESSETEKQKVYVKAREVEESLEAALREVSLQRAKVAELLAYCADLDKLTADKESGLTSKAADGVKVGVGETAINTTSYILFLPDFFLLPTFCPKSK